MAAPVSTLVFYGTKCGICSFECMELLVVRPIVALLSMVPDEYRPLRRPKPLALFVLPAALASLAWFSTDC